MTVQCVLVIDDEPFVRESLERVLRSPQLMVIAILGRDGCSELQLSVPWDW